MLPYGYKKKLFELKQFFLVLDACTKISLDEFSVNLNEVYRDILAFEKKKKMVLPLFWF